MKNTATEHPHGVSKSRLWKVIFASSAGTVIEWYDFYIFGSLAAIISTKFFPPDNPTAAFLSTLATHGAGFVARPFGAVVFGRLGDRIGRKYTFLLTLLLMGGSTFAIAFVPQYAQIGLLAPVLLLLMRVVQGLALGGEYGGAATYVAEHAPAHQRGKYTSYIQTTASLGFFASILVILGCQFALGREVFSDWGWRLPFALSGILVVLSYFIRRNMDESPAFEKLKKENKLSKTPLREAFTNAGNLKLMLLAMFGAIIGQGVIWHTSQFYAQIFLTKILSVEYTAAQLIMAVAVTLATPLFVVFGTLSDRVGRKPIMMAGMLLAAVFFYPIYWGMDRIVNGGQPVRTETVSGVSVAHYADGRQVRQERVALSGQTSEIRKEVILPLKSKLLLIALVFGQVFFATLAYGPIAAFLVELFPTRIRYTSLSIPYHISNGWFGGCAPFIATWLGSVTGSRFAGIYYPIFLAGLTFVIGMLYLKETSGKKLED